MSELDSLIEARELQVDCRQCGWRGDRSLAWLAARRDMGCPACKCVIVLNTSGLRRQMSALRRQVEALHRQLVDSIPAASRMLSRLEAPPHTSTVPSLQLSLMVVYKDSARRRADVSSRRTARDRRDL